MVERSSLARLRADEANMERRKLNVSNFGATWLKPPGVAKSLFQMREERREQEEHAEAMRREQLAQELAEAEAAGAAAVAARLDGEEAGEAGMTTTTGDLGAMDGVVDLDVELDPMDEDMVGGGERDLDDDIPDADDGVFGADGDDDDDDEDDDEDEDEDEDEEDESDSLAESGMGVGAGQSDGAGVLQNRRAEQRELASRMATVRAAEDRAREQVLRGQGPGSDIYGGEEELDDQDQAQMLEEEDLVDSSRLRHGGVEPGMDMDMDANLDDDIPEAESDRYEHTDTEAELSSSDNDDDDDDDDGNGPNTSFAAARASQTSRFRTSLAHSDVTRTSIDISGILSRDGSSFLDSSPNVRRGP